ncbi:MAG: transcriptional regulator GcvA [Rhizobiales bacterium]|nr:transcriptional regulator GcvA [Hyphomicrobiales bacterium]
MIELFPGLRSLRAFDAAATYLNFTRAAEVLGVTPAAISHQIKELEGVVGVPLFARTSRSMVLTRQGEILHAAAHESLEVLSRALIRIKRMENRQQIRVSASPSLAAKWLVPRLERFLGMHPGADVRVDVSHAVVDFDREDVDVAIRFGEGKYPGLRSDLLFQDNVFPVCSPKIITKERPLKTPRDLLRYTLIHLDWEAQGQPWPNWKMWMKAAGVNDFDDRAGLHFGQTSYAVQAAIDGLGVALGDSNLVADDLAAGRLVKPFELSLRAPKSFAYFLITRLDTSDAPLVDAFRDWCLTEAKQTESRLAANGAGTTAP